MNGSSGLHLTRGTDVRPLASGFIEWLVHLDADPFAKPIVFVQGPAMQRWLSQRVARASDPSGQGICAGVRFEPLSRLEVLLSGRDPADDPWAPERVVWRILELVEEGTPGLELLDHHLAASEQRYANAARVAHLLDRYARLRPTMLRRWSEAASVGDLDLNDDAWQAVLWRALLHRVEGPSPVARRSDLLDGLACGAVGLEAPAVALFCPRHVTRTDADLLRALAIRTRVDVWLGLAGPGNTENPLVERLGRRGGETSSLLEEVATTVTDLPPGTRPATLLGAIQEDMAAAAAPLPRDLDCSDGSLDVHASHGADRQVEVLREVLAGLFADDPTLEPRDVVIACPDPDALAPHLTAAFSGTHLAGRGHPGLTFRVQVAERSAADSNQLLALVETVTELGASRATVTHLLGLIAHPFVARRFGFGADDIERLGALVPSASVRWGLNEAHRREFGLAQVRQGTWQVGVQRLLLGEALSDDELASAGVIAPVDDVDSSDVELLGGFAELVSRVSRLARHPQRATAAEWVQYLRTVVDLLTDVPFEEAWQLGQLWAVLDRVERRSGDSPALLGSADALELLDAEFATYPGRPAFGNGSLVVCGLHALAQVPHRVVCLIGLDERSFPRRGIADGDDLLANGREPGEPDPGRDDRQSFLDAVRSAEERLVIVFQGSSSHTRENRPPPPGLVDLLEAAATTTGTAAADTLIVSEPLQPFSPTYFSGEPRSFDAAGLRGARALTSPRRGVGPNRYAVGHLPPPPESDAVELEDVRALLSHPARFLLRERAGLTLGEDEALAETLPLELDALAQWKIGQRILAGLMRGHDVPDVQRAEWLRGDLPPGYLGSRILDRVTSTAAQIAAAAAPWAAASAEVHTIDLALDGVRLRGRATTRSGVALSTEYSRVSARQLASSWVDALALTVQLGRPVGARLFGKGRPARLEPPGPAAAHALLATLVDLTIDGRRRILPMPPRVALRWATCRARNTDPHSEREIQLQWEYDRDATWDAVLAPGEKPWDARVVAGEPWARRGETTLLGSLADVAWRPIVGAQA